MTLITGTHRCDYCSHSAKYSHTTRHPARTANGRLAVVGQQRDACETHVSMLVRLLGSNGGQITNRLGQQAQLADLIYPER